MEYTFENICLTDDSITDKFYSIVAEELDDKTHTKQCVLKCESDILSKLMNIAFYDIESNIVEDGDTLYFGAGKTFGKAVFTRDISISGILALNKYYPEIMMKSLQYTREARTNTGFQVGNPLYAVEDIKASWKVTNKKNDYHCGAITRRSDDVIWIWAMWDLIQKNNYDDQLEWFYETGEWFFDNIYQPFYDENDGLYRGQAVFVDVHFPLQKANGYPLEWSIGDCVLIKALSTNCVYKMAFDIMKTVAIRLGKDEDTVKRWEEASKNIQSAIIKNLQLPNGTLSYFKDKHGNLTPRNDALGIALAIITDTVDKEYGKQLISQYPLCETGIPLFHPFFDFTEGMKKYKVFDEGIYHNDSSWGFVDTFFLTAYEKVMDVDMKPLNLAMVGRMCRDQSSFRELVNFINKEPFGSHNQLWTAAAYINTLERMDLIG